MILWDSHMKKIFRKIIIIVTVVFIFQILSYFFNSNNIFPSPFSLWLAFVNNFSSVDIYMHILSSLRRVLVGFFIASIFGVSLALLIGYYKKIGYHVNPVIEILRPIPPIAWIPIAILIFGLGDKSSYFIVFLGAFFPIFTNTYFGVISLPKIYINVAASFEIKGMAFVKNILFYFSLPYIFTGLKIGMGMAWMSVIAAELIGAQSGLGYFIQINRLLLRVDNIILGMILIGLVGFLLTKSISLVEKRVILWKK